MKYALIKSYLKAIRFIQIKMSCSRSVMTVHNKYGCVFAYISTITRHNTLICYYNMIINEPGKHATENDKNDLCRDKNTYVVNSSS